MAANTTQQRCETGSPDSDVADWVRRLQAGDPTALEPLMTKYDALVRHVAWLIVHDAADAADIAQETWLRLLATRTPLRNPEHVFAWLRTTAQRLAIEAARRRSRTTALEDSAADTLATPHEDGPAAQIERDDRDARVRRALAMMPVERSGLLVDLVCSGDSYQAVGKRWCRPIGSLGPTRRRYLVELRGHLAAQGVGEPEW